MKNVQVLLTAVFAFVSAHQAALANDGVVDYKDFPLLLDPATKSFSAIGGAANALKEWKEATPEQRAELQVWAAKEFDIPNDKIELKIEAGINMVVQAGALFDVA